MYYTAAAAASHFQCDFKFNLLSLPNKPDSHELAYLERTPGSRNGFAYAFGIRSLVIDMKEVNGNAN